MDDFVNTTEPIMNDEEIISDVLDDENLEAEEDEDGDVDILIEPTCPQSGDVRQALEVLRRYMIFSDNGECISYHISYHISHYISYHISYHISHYISYHISYHIIIYHHIIPSCHIIMSYRHVISSCHIVMSYRHVISSYHMLACGSCGTMQARFMQNV